VDTLDYPPLDIGYHIECLRREGALLAEAASRAGLDADVPACPGWQVRDLLAHIGYVHRWATGYVSERHTRWVERLTEAQTLASADPELECWSFLEAPSPLAFWARRQVHETAIHRVDAEQAIGEQQSHPARFAIDGIDELLMGFVARDASRGSWRCPPGVLGFHADDGEGGTAHWRVVSRAGQGSTARQGSTAGQGAVSRGAWPADCDVTGPSAELYLLLWNRGTPDGLDISGDEKLLDGFREQARVTWR
jgi:uncharacterized protein (TIGR03083 family)